MQTRWRGSLQLLIGGALTFLFFYMMAPFMVAILLGAIIAILVFPFYEFLTRKLPRSLSSFLVTSSVILGILLPLMFVLYNASFKLLGSLKQIQLPSSESAKQVLLNYPILRKTAGLIGKFVPLDKEWMQQQFLHAVQVGLERLSRLITLAISELPGLMLGFLVVLLATYFFLIDGGKFLKFLASLSPLKADRSIELYRTFESSCRGVVLGLLASALVQSILMIFFFTITGIPNAFLMGFLTMGTSLVPLVGSMPVAIGGIIYLFATGSPWMAVVLIVGSCIIAVSDNIIRPLIMKEQSEMHPLLALVSVFGAIQLIGPTGIFLGPIIAAVFVAFLKMTSQEIRESALQSAQTHNLT